MSRTITSVKAASGALAAIALIFGAVASGQAQSAKEGVTVQARKIVVLKHRNPRTGIQNETLELSERVGFSDIDIGTQVGEVALHGRIRSAAESVCGQLGKLFLATSAEDERMDRAACIRRAIDHATKAVQPAIVAAREARHK